MGSIDQFDRRPKRQSVTCRTLSLLIQEGQTFAPSMGGVAAGRISNFGGDPSRVMIFE